MSIRSLISAAHAAGFVMAITEDFPSDEGASETQTTKDAHAEAGATTSRALALRAPEPAERSVWMREWFQGIRGRATA